MRPFAGIAAVLLMTLGAAGSHANAQPSGSAVELESPVATSRPLHDLLRLPDRTGASAAAPVAALREFLHVTMGDKEKSR